MALLESDYFTTRVERNAEMSDSGSTSFGTLLRQRRVAARFTQEALAEAAGVSTRAITDLERGVIRAPRRDTLELLADALELSGDEREEWRKLRADLSARLSDTTPGDRLPQPPNQLIGREREVNALVNLLTHADTRLITVTGPGGVGKTRVALAVAHAMSGSFRDGIHFIELASIQDPDLVLPAIAQQLGLRETNPEATRKRLKAVLASRQILLILDNMEHLRPAAGDISELLAHSDTVTILATSRAGLRIAAEHVFPVAPLPLPDWDPGQIPNRLGQYPGIELFVQRARQVSPGFELTPENAAPVSAICSWLDGIPLAIELAAARISVLPPQQLLARLADRLNFLTDGLRDAPDRHQTMRSAIGWSYELLDPPHQELFRALSIFVGSWTLEAAEAVAPNGIDLMNGIARLADDNLIHQVHDETSARFTMLQTIREFGLEQLEYAGELTDLQQRHAAYVLALVEEGESHIRGRDQIEWLNRLATESADIRAALAWSQREDVPAEHGLRLTASLVWYWEARGEVFEAREWLARAIERGSNDHARLMPLLSGAGWMAHIQQDSPAAADLLEHSLRIARELGADWWQAWNLHLLGRVAYFRGDAKDAHRCARESLQIATTLSDQWLMSWDYHLSGLASFIEGDLTSTREKFAESLRLREEIGYPEGISLINGLTGVLLIREGKYQPALDYLRVAIEIGGQLGARWLVINWIANLIYIAAERGQFEPAARLVGFVDASSERTGAIPIPITTDVFEQGRQAVISQLDEATVAPLFTEGQAMSLHTAVREALKIIEQQESMMLETGT